MGIIATTLVVVVLTLLFGLIVWWAARSHRNRVHRCRFCGTPIPGPGVCSKKCSVAARAKEIKL